MIGSGDGVLVVGITGAGKTTLARALAERLGLRVEEVDALQIGPGWSERPTFLSDLDAFTATPGWVLDSYGSDPRARALIWSRATVVIWLDLPLRVTAARAVRRSLGRSWRAEPVFGGNVETWASWLSGGHPAWSSIRNFNSRRRTLAGLIATYQVDAVRLRRRSEVQAFLEAVR